MAREYATYKVDRMEQREYVWRLLVAYRTTPGTCGVVRRADRLLAAQLHERGVPVETVENALTLAAVRRLMRPEESTPLSTVRSLAYFVPVIEEVLQKSGLLPVSAPQARSLPCAVAARLIEPTPAFHPRACGADDTVSLHQPPSTPRTPPAWMIMPPTPTH